MSTCDNCGAFAFFVQAAPDECPFCASENVTRKPGCLCQWEEGDSPCPVHGEHDESAAVRGSSRRCRMFMFNSTRGKQTRA